MNFKNIVVKKTQHLGVLKINRTKFNNAIDIETSFEIFKGLKKLEEDKNIRCVAIIGNEKFFSPGADIEELENRYKIIEDFRK